MKNKNLSLIRGCGLGLMVVIIFMATSCTKDFVSDVDNCYLMNKARPNGVSNLTNPYDYVGDIHNSVLAKCMQNSYFNFGLDHLPTSEELVYLVDQYFPCYDTSLHINCSTDADTVSGAVGLLYDGIGDFYEDFIWTSNLSYLSQSYLRDIYGTIGKMFAVSGIRSLDSYLDTIKHRESLILGDPSYTDVNSGIPINERRIMLTSTAILRHSLYFWWGELNVDNGGGINNDPTQEKLAWLKILTIAGADALFAVVSCNPVLTGLASAGVAVGMAMEGDVEITVEENDDGTHITITPIEEEEDDDDE